MERFCFGVVLALFSVLVCGCGSVSAPPPARGAGADAKASVLEKEQPIREERIFKPNVIYGPFEDPDAEAEADLQDQAERIVENLSKKPGAGQCYILGSTGGDDDGIIFIKVPGRIEDAKGRIVEKGTLHLKYRRTQDGRDFEFFDVRDSAGKEFSLELQMLKR